jgi:hypothetical protein
MLKPTVGELLIAVGLSGREQTEEFGRADKMLSSNRRSYGRDFSERLEAGGFQVTTLSYELTPEQLTRYGVYPETFYRCRKL